MDEICNDYEITNLTRACIICLEVILSKVQIKEEYSIPTTESKSFLIMFLFVCFGGWVLAVWENSTVTSDLWSYIHEPLMHNITFTGVLWDGIDVLNADAVQQ